MQSAKNVFKNTLKFRNAMDLTLSKDNIKYIWGRRFLKNLENSRDSETQQLLTEVKENQNQNVSEKVKIAQKHIDKLKFHNWVKFIGISGSVAAGFATKEDDIDIFVVVKNQRMWLYRAIVVLRNLFHNHIRAKRHEDIKDKLCLNLICEERGLQFPADIFNFHELIFLKPIYKKGYKRYILSQNMWLRRKFFVKKELLRTRIMENKKTFLPIKVLNLLAFHSQLLFMLISGHKPEIKRIMQNSKKGRIEFFESDYRVKKIKNYSKEFKSTN